MSPKNRWLSSEVPHLSSPLPRIYRQVSRILEAGRIALLSGCREPVVVVVIVVAAAIVAAVAIVVALALAVVVAVAEAGAVAVAVAVAIVVDA